MTHDKDRYLSILLISPSILAVLIFVYGFIAWSMRVSLSKWKGLTARLHLGRLKNYIDLFSDPRFHVDIRNTLIFTGGLCRRLHCCWASCWRSCSIRG